MKLHKSTKNLLIVMGITIDAFAIILWKVIAKVSSLSTVDPRANSLSTVMIVGIIIGTILLIIGLFAPKKQ